MPDQGQHVVGGVVPRYELQEILKQEGLDRLDPVYWEDEDGNRQIMAFVRCGEGEAVAEAFDVAWCNRPTPAAERMVEEAVMARVEELMAEGFRAGITFARTGQLPGSQLPGQEKQP